MSKSSDAAEHQSDALSENITSQNAIKVNIINAQSDYVISSTRRDQLSKAARLGMKTQLFKDFMIIGAYAIAGVILHSVFINCLISPEQCDANDRIFGHAFRYFLFLTLFLIWSIMRYVGYKYQFKAHNDGLNNRILPIWKLVFAVFAYRWYMLLAIIVMVSAFLNGLLSILLAGKLSGLLLLAAVGFHLIVIRKTRRERHQRPNLKLLILRVFLIDKTSLFTFARLAKYWRHFGNYFTITDPSFLKVYWTQKIRNNVVPYLVLMLIIYIEIESSLGVKQSFLVFVIFLMVIALITLMIIEFTKRAMASSFIKSPDDLKTSLQQLNTRPLRADNTFKEKPMACYDNTWKFTVEKLVTSSQVILMDLRGFSEENKGCEYEVNLLLNSVKLERILFIGYASAIDLIEKVIKSQFEALTETSPNIHSDQPEALLYVVHQESTKETQQLLDLLISKAL